MSQYLTQEWFDEFVKLAADQPARPGASVKIQYRVTDAPSGTIDYYWNVEDGVVTGASLGELEDPDFSIKMAYADSAAVQKGDLDATAAFMQGKTKVSGAVAKMMSLMPITNSPEWQELQEKIKAMTEY